MEDPRRLQPREGNCECGNNCYKVYGAQPPYLVEEAHLPAECPYDCEDCEETAAQEEEEANEIH